MRQFAIHLLPIFCALLGGSLIPGLRSETIQAAEHAAADHASSGESVEAEPAAGHHPDYNSPPLLPEIPLLVFSLVLFTGFVLFMRPAVWTPLMNSLNAREQRIERAEAEAKSALHEAERLTAQAERRMEEIQRQVAGILAGARHDAEVRKAEILAQAEEEAERMKSEAIAAIRQARDQALQDLDNLVEGQVAVAFNHVVGRQ